LSALQILAQSIVSGSSMKSLVAVLSDVTALTVAGHRANPPAK
jgi:hypothetical protein